MLYSGPISFLLTYVLLPIWIAAGFADYLCHRATDIEHASGASESISHWIMLGEIGLPLLAAVFLKINALMLVFFGVCIVAHEVTTHIDLQIAIHTRKVTAFEQQVHSVLEMSPVAALLLIVILHWPQAQAIFGLGPQAADFGIAFDLPTNWTATIVLFSASVVLLAIPYTEELVRGARAQARGHVRSPIVRRL